MNNLSRRVSKLEQSELLSVPPSVMERFTTAYDEATSRLTRSGLAADDAAMGRVAEEVVEGLFPTLNESEREELIEQLLQIGYGDDSAAKEAVRQAAIEQVTNETSQQTDRQA